MKSTFSIIHPVRDKVLLVSIVFLALVSNGVQTAYAHEEGATTVTVDNILGPILALAIIILAIVVAKRIKDINKMKYGQN